MHIDALTLKFIFKRNLAVSWIFITSCLNTKIPISPLWTKYTYVVGIHFECLFDTPGARALARDQNVQFLRIGQFLSNYKGYGLHTCIHLHLGKTNRKPYLMITFISWFIALRKNVQFLRFGYCLSS